MAEITTGATGRTDVGWVNRSAADKSDQAKYTTIRTHNATKAVTFYTGSKSGTKGFIIEEASDSIITPSKGDSITASVLTGSLDVVFEIGLESISGSGKIHVLY